MWSYCVNVLEKYFSLILYHPPAQLFSMASKQYVNRCFRTDEVFFLELSVVAEFGRIALELLKRGTSTKIYEGAASKNL